MLQALRGTTDLLPEEVARWSAVEHAARRLARIYGYREVRTPVIEEAALFLRSVGETTDIVQKEMFRFTDRGEHEIVLRPEGTAAVVRAYLERNLHKTEGFAKLFYLGPMFRAERPQAGRFRQFHQYGVEAIGSTSPWVDVEAIALCVHILRECGVGDATVWLASMGCRKDQARSAEELRKRLEPHKSKLCKECQARLQKNVFRVLDCKNPDCHAIAWDMKAFFLCNDCTAHFQEVRRGLKETGIAFDDTKYFARGLDYYTRTVFEVRVKGLGAQDAVAAGGRYDQLVEELGGPPMGAFGFAAGIERVLMAAGTGATSAEPPARAGVYLAVAQPPLIGEAFRLVQRLRECGVPALMDYDGKSLKAQFREADKALARLVAVLGETELAQGSITVKDLGAGSQRTVPLDSFIEEISREEQGRCH
ncbi:MAG: histidine--tRNA ligase [Omnitrophica WOR_2 bacterium RIFCSPHIGHO2_02_FULL_67_20]|nr:MAG: histidine--tRNA ligase [Omnitrophica WOR_2 bacterium RIFCSPHIGHO2_02_FULL_67_20]